jgi:Uma2 family endonuclease
MATESVNFPVYERVKGKPIYFKDYKEFGFKDVPRLDSTAQAFLKNKLVNVMGNELLSFGYEILLGSPVLQITPDNKRIVDLAAFESGALTLNDQFATLPPLFTVEIDFHTHVPTMEYIFEKIADYHNFGVQKVFWVFTKNKKVMVAPSGQPWLTLDWSADVEVVEGLVINLADIVAKKKG